MVYGDLQFFDIIIFAVIAVFIIYRLRSVLGKRTGFQKSSNEQDLLKKQTTQKEIKIPQLNENEQKLEVVYKHIPSFDHKVFLEGAKKAFEIIITAFNKGDKSTLKGLVSKELYKETKYLDPIEIANDTAKKLKETENCDLVICLSHLGYKYEKVPNRICDVNLAKETKDIDLIIGGHTHTFMNEPLITYNKAGKKVLINQAGCFGLYLGRIDFLFDSNNNKVFNSNLLMI